MEVSTGTPQTTILINLSSKLLCEVLQRFLEKDATYRPVLAHDSTELHGFTPHNVLVDAAVLEQSVPTQWGEAKVILIDTGLSEDEIIRLLIVFKLHGVISTSTGTDLFLKALEAIGAGQIWIGHGKIKTILHNLSLTGIATAENFSRREREIVQLSAEGRTNREIASRLNISGQTVKTHMSRILWKAEVASRTQLVPLALKFRLESTTHAPHNHVPS